MITLWDKFKSAIRLVATDVAAVATMEVTPDPVWVSQPAVSAPNGPPTLSTDGVDLAGAQAAMVGVVFASGTTAVDLIVHTYSGGAWGAPTNGAISITRNLTERAEVAGCTRAYIEIVSTDGECTPRIGPCGLEG